MTAKKVGIVLPSLFSKNKGELVETVAGGFRLDIEFCSGELGDGRAATVTCTPK
jgi:hypothetical protein